MTAFNSNTFGSSLFNGTNDSPQVGRTVIPKTSLQVTNSTTYVDLLGLSLGLERFPGESSIDFMVRVRAAAVVSRGATYRGLVNELGLQFDLPPHVGISLTIPSSCAIQVVPGLIIFTFSDHTLRLETVTVDPDGFWEWKNLSEVVELLNHDSSVTARLVSEDGPAFQLVQQSNSTLVVGEDLTGQISVLRHPGFVLGSETFNQEVPYYTLISDSVLEFAAPPLSGTQITYTARSIPYSLIVSPAGLFSMQDPNFQAISVDASGAPIYQVKRYLQELLQKDRSYWAQ